MVDAFVESVGLPGFVSSSKYSGEISEGVVVGEEVAVLKPATFMNKSGGAVQKLVPRNEVSNLIVIYDDVDVPLGDIKVSVGRGDGGHNGMKSIIASMGSKAFIRVRVGVAQKTVWPWEKGETRRPKGAALPKFVLKDFTKKEEVVLASLAPRITTCLTTIITNGVEKAMNECN